MALYVRESAQPRIEGIVKVDLNKDEEVRYMFRADTNVLFECYKAKAIDRCVTGLYCHRVWQRRETKPHMELVSCTEFLDPINLTRYNASETLSSRMIAMTLSEDTLFQGFSCPTEAFHESSPHLVAVQYARIVLEVFVGSFEAELKPHSREV